MYFIAINKVRIVRRTMLRTDLTLHNVFCEAHQERVIHVNVIENNLHYRNSALTFVLFSSNLSPYTCYANVAVISILMTPTYFQKYFHHILRPRTTWFYQVRNDIGLLLSMHAPVSTWRMKSLRPQDYTHLLFIFWKRVCLSIY